MRKYWNETEKELLRKLYENDGLAPSEIAKLMNRTITAITIKCQKWNFKHSKEQQAKIKSRLLSGKNNGMFGKVPKNKGLNKETSENIRIAAQKLSATRKRLYKEGKIPLLCGENNPMFGKPAWNTGLTALTDERIKKYGKLISIIKKRQWAELPENVKNEVRIFMAYIGAKCKKKDTVPEIKIKEYLDSINEDYIQGYVLDTFVFDFFIFKYNLVIECQGDYWHANPIKYNDENINDIQRKNINRDKRKKEFIKKNNLNSLFIWETDIRKHFAKVEKMIMDKINEFL